MRLRTKFKGTWVRQGRRRVPKSRRGFKRLGTWTLVSPQPPMRGRKGDICLGTWAPCCFTSSLHRSGLLCLYPCCPGDSSDTRQVDQGRDGLEWEGLE